MHCLDLWVLAGKNVLRSGLRTLLCLLAICIGVTSVSSVLALGGAAGQTVKREIEKIGIDGVIFYRNNGEEIPEEVVRTIEMGKGVEHAMAFSMSSGKISLLNQRFSAGILGIDENLGNVLNLNLLHGTLPTENQVKAGENIAVVDADLALNTYKRINIVGKSIMLTLNGRAESFRVCGVIEPQAAFSDIFGSSMPHIIYVPESALQKLDTEVYRDKLILTTGKNEPDMTARAVAKALKRTYNESYPYENMNHYLSSFARITDSVQWLAGGIAGISMLVGGIGVMNVMLSATDVRVQEIGIYRALGASKWDIVRTFLLESIFLCMGGGIAGIVISRFLFSLLEQRTSVQVTFRWEIALTGLGVSACCGILFGLLPAIRAAKLDPIRAIRSK